MATSALVLVNGLPTMQAITASTPAAYDQSIYYASGLAASSTITLPSSGSFSSSTAADILIILNDRILEVTRDFTVMGSGPTYTQIQNVYAFTNDSVLRFKSHLA